MVTLPHQFSNLSALQYLNMRDNKLREVPKPISSLVQLKELSIRNILCSEISPVIYLTQLYKLDASKNLISDIPEQVLHTEDLLILLKFSSLTSLRKLNIGFNKLEKKPSVVEKMSLEALVLLGNSCDDIKLPKEIPEFKGNEVKEVEESTVGKSNFSSRISCSGYGKVSLKIPEGYSKLSNDILCDKIRGRKFL